MADNATADPILNPNTPLAFLEPEAAYQTAVSIYVTAASLGVLVWDILDNISEEYKVLFRNRINLSTLVYIGSRVGSLGYVLSSAIFTTAPTGNCEVFEKVVDAWYPISLGCSALLFFFRVSAIYNRNRLVVAFFFMIWLGLLACTLFIPIGVLGTNIGNTKYCQDADVPPTAYAAIIAPLVHDTLVFIAISWRLTRNAHIDSDSGKLSEGFKVALLGKYLPQFTRGLLRDGQRYYLITLVSSLLTVVMAFDTSVPVPMRSMCATPNIVLVNIMACRVYRRTKAGVFRELEISTIGKSPRTAPQISIHTNRTRTSDGPPFRVDIELATVTSPTANSGSEANSMYKVDNGMERKEYFGEAK
ncbi:hypothetical protein BDN70DRAFT_853708 [Pholiota conissans]|uniref:DUF6533 domain-containing protein n=1 Tax=Pholiota conissans TaxID=109636 RepID=A0A9P6D3M0_9AGAR|nr:hypothetical protein BDN70DRAFT_853708 [Pholiota conissans]